MENTNNITQYFSKHRKEWVEFKDRHGYSYKPNKAEIEEYLKYNYKLR